MTAPDVEETRPDGPVYLGNHLENCTEGSRKLSCNIHIAGNPPPWTFHMCWAHSNSLLWLRIAFREGHLFPFGKFFLFFAWISRTFSYELDKKDLIMIWKDEGFHYNKRSDCSNYPGHIQCTTINGIPPILVCWLWQSRSWRLIALGSWYLLCRFQNGMVLHGNFFGPVHYVLTWRNK